MERVRIKNPLRFIPWIYGLVIVIAAAVSLVAAVIFGSAGITWSATIQIILHHLFRTELDESVPVSSDTIIWNLRAPRGILAAIVGVGLAVFGMAMQTLVHNLLANPYLLGISAGVGAGATAVTIFGVFPGSPIAPLTSDALFGAVMATLAVDVFTTAGGGLIPLCLVLFGIVFSTVLSALNSFMVFAGPDLRAARSVMFWILGSVAGATWVKMFSPLIVLVAVLLFFLVRARQLDALATGESTAAAVGIDVTRLHAQVFVLQTALVGALVAVSGGIGSAGLVIPHLTRILVGVMHRVVLPVAALMGGLFLIWVDIIAHIVGGNQEMPLGVVARSAGVPLFLYPMSRSHYSYEGAE